MTEDPLVRLVTSALVSIAPDIEGEEIDPKEPFSDQFEIDSMDRFVAPDNERLCSIRESVPPPLLTDWGNNYSIGSPDISSIQVDELDGHRFGDSHDVVIDESKSVDRSTAFDLGLLVGKLCTWGIQFGVIEIPHFDLGTTPVPQRQIPPRW